MNREPWHILLIDDNAEDRADLRRMLLQGAQRRYRFSEAARGDEGLRMALDPANGRVDCVLLDYHLPDMDAPDVLAALCNGADLPPCPVVVVTAADNEEGPALLRAGAQDYIGKRWTSAEGLTRAVANSIERFGLLAERKRGVEALRQSEERYRGLFNSIDEGFCIIEMLFDEHGTANDYRFLQVNPSFERQCGLVNAQGKTISELVPQLEAGWFKAYGKVALTGEPARIEGLAESMGRWFDIYAFRTGAPALRQVAILFTDTTERVRVAAALLAATAAADQANRAKSDFLSSMSHELRSPLSAILGFAQLIETGTPAPSASQQESVGQILQAGWYLLALINEILDLALIESGKLSVSAQAVSLGELMADCQAMIEPQAQASGVRLSYPRFEQPCFVQADRTRAKQVLVNLLSNAIKYNRSGGQVDVRCQRLPAQRVRVSVRDTGPGLSAEQLAQLFEPFNRLGQEEGPVQGTGIGLVVSKQLVELMGGCIGAESSPGVGSLFWFELNAAAALATEPADDAAAPGRPAPVRPPGEARRRTVLCVEDNAANMKLVERLVGRRPDLGLLRARHAQRGLEIAREARPDVILMDIHLPGMSGVQAMALLAADPATAQIPVVALSAHAMPQDIEAGLAAGFLRYLTKPIRVEEFMHTLDLALEIATTNTARAAAEETP